jgi:hypothetical protein
MKSQSPSKLDSQSNSSPGAKKRAQPFSGNKFGQNKQVSMQEDSKSVAIDSEIGSEYTEDFEGSIG